MNIRRCFDFLINDLKRNRRNTKGLFLVISFRIANFCYRLNKLCPILIFTNFPVVIAYKLVNEWVLGVELKASTSVGYGLRIYHGVGLVIHENTVIGNNVTLRHNTTIGTEMGEQEAPVIGDNVNIGPHTVMIGKIHIGNNVIIGAGTVITKEVPPNAVVIGNPQRIIKYNRQFSLTD
jgi:putative colanic acid biosynthesis acetyltransferase WcaB